MKMLNCSWKFFPGEMEQMTNHIRKLRLCIKWFQELEEGHLVGQEKLHSLLEFAEKKCTIIGNLIDGGKRSASSFFISM